MKRKQTTALILAALITASMAGCQSGSAQTAPQVTAGTAKQTDVLESTSEAVTELTTLAETVSVAEQQNSVTTTAETESNELQTTYEITEWTPDFFSSIECCGIQIEYPWELSEFEEHFEIEIGEINHKFYNFYHNDQFVGSVTYNENEFQYNEQRMLKSALSLVKYDVNGLSEKSTKQDVQSVLGNGNFMDNEYGDFYYFGNIAISFSYLDDESNLTIFQY